MCKNREIGHRPSHIFICMDRHRFEQGVQRLYYVAWVLFSGGYVIAGTWEFLSRGGSLAFSPELLLGLVVLVGVCLVPGVLMLVGRWIYRGFFPAA